MLYYLKLAVILSNLGGEATTEQLETADIISPEQMPETTQAVLGYIPILEAAALVIAKEKGFFAKDMSALFSR